jgi:hypothetical protein
MLSTMVWICWSRLAKGGEDPVQIGHQAGGVADVAVERLGQCGEDVVELLGVDGRGQRTEPIDEGVEIDHRRGLTELIAVLQELRALAGDEGQEALSDQIAPGDRHSGVHGQLDAPLDREADMGLSVDKFQPGDLADRDTAQPDRVPGAHPRHITEDGLEVVLRPELEVGDLGADVHGEANADDHERNQLDQLSRHYGTPAGQTPGRSVHTPGR